MNALLLQVPGIGIAVTVVVLAAVLFVLFLVSSAVRILRGQHDPCNRGPGEEGELTILCGEGGP